MLGAAGEVVEGEGDGRRGEVGSRARRRTAAAAAGFVAALVD